MAYDSLRDRIVLFGGLASSTSTTALNDTWEFNGSTWQQVATGPMVTRYGAFMCYDPIRQACVLYGGANGPTSYSDTWEWNGTTWTQRATVGPEGQYGPCMAFDSTRGRVVMFGGEQFIGGVGTFKSTLSEWTGTNWAPLSTAGPSPRDYARASYDALRQSFVVFGGRTTAGGQLVGDAWEWSYGYVSISGGPASAIACPTGSAGFSITAAGSSPRTYQWQIQTAPNTWQLLGNDFAPLLCGGGAAAYATPINSPVATIGVIPCPGSPGQPQHFQVRCVVTNACGSVNSNEATYTTCPADFNCSGGPPTVTDIFAFLTAWFASDPSADFNQSGGAPTVSDIFAFLTAWFSGC